MRAQHLRPTDGPSVYANTFAYWVVENASITLPLYGIQDVFPRAAKSGTRKL